MSAKVSKSKKTMVRILNPVDGCGLTSLEHARRYVRRKEAEWEGDGVAIRFLDSSKRSVRVLASARAACRYDDGLASLGDVEGLPVAGPAIRLFTGKRPPAGTVREDRVVVLSVRMVPGTFLREPVCA